MVRITRPGIAFGLILGLMFAGRCLAEVAFFATSDCHYTTTPQASARLERNTETLKQMNDLPGTAWPERLGGGVIAKPRGVLVLGDMIDDGDRKDQTQPQWEQFAKQFGLDGTDGLLHYPIFEGWGNHDGPPAELVKNGFSVQAQIKTRNLLRKQKGLISNLSENGMHYSWDWDKVHFVHLNLYPADRQNPKVHYSPTWHDPQLSLSFLLDDLKKNVGISGRPVVLVAHCGFETDWWNREDWEVFYNSIKSYNTIVYLHGHTGTKVYQWKPSPDAKPLDVINTGQTEKGFFVVEISDTRIRSAYRIKNPKAAEQETMWTWQHFLDKPISSPPAAAAPTTQPAGR